MVVTKDRYLVVVSVLDGKQFPARGRHSLVIEGKFDGEVLTTDSVPHTETVDFTQELAWEQEKKTLQFHRTQRSSIKLQCYAVDDRSQAKEMIGYVVLDVKSAPTITGGEEQPKYKWCSLLHSKYHKSKPMIRVGVYIDEKTADDDTQGPTQEAEIPLTKLRPVRNDAGGFFQIGPAGSCKEDFVFSVTLNYANNLYNLIPLNDRSKFTHGFFFFFEVLGSEISTECFHDITTGNFPPERTSVKIRSSPQAIRQFFSYQAALKVHFCCDKESFGFAEVPYAELVEALTHSAVTSSEDSYYMRLSSDDATPLTGDNRPALNVTLSVQRPQSTAVSAGVSLVTSPMKEVGSGVPPSGRSMFIPRSKHGLSSAQHHYEMAVNFEAIKSSSAADIANGALRFKCTQLHLKQLLQVPAAIDVSSDGENAIHNGRCSFEFATSPKSLAQVLLDAALHVELWSQKENQEELLLASGEVSLFNLQHAEVTQVSQSSGTICPQQSVTENVSLIAPSLAEKLCSVKCVLSLRDLGFTKSRRASSPAKRKLVLHDEQPQQDQKLAVASDLAYDAAMELELWKEMQEKVFEKHLKQKELKYLTHLTEDWQRREEAREAAVKRKIDEYQRLQGEMSAGLAELKQRLEAAHQKELALEFTEEKVRKEVELQTIAYKEAARRAHEEGKHRVSLEAAKRHELEELVGTLRQEVARGDSRLREQVAEYDLWRHKQQQAPEAQLQRELNSLLLEKVELERKLDAALKSKLHYKQQWGATLRELATVRERQAAEARKQLNRQAQELDHIRLRYLAAEEKEVIDEEQAELEKIRQEVAALRKSTAPAVIPADEVKSKEVPGLAWDEHIARLVEERDSLLKTGVYSADDNIIIELDKQVREAIASSNR